MGDDNLNQEQIKRHRITKAFMKWHRRVSLEAPNIDNRERFRSYIGLRERAFFAGWRAAMRDDRIDVECFINAAERGYDGNWSERIKFLDRLVRLVAEERDSLADAKETNHSYRVAYRAASDGYTVP